jgi:signal transduction histidine kinase
MDESLKTLLRQYGIENLLTKGVLCVDDDPSNLVVLAPILEKDYVVFQAESGQDALGIAKGNDLDIIIADQRMPGMTGVELLEAVNKDKPDIAGIVLTAYTDAPAIIAAINRARAFRFLTKPFDPQDILLACADASTFVYQRRAIRRLVEILAQRNEALEEALNELKAMQERMIHMERLSTIGKMSSGVTHDMRNFLSGLVYLEYELGSKQEIAEDVKDTVRVCLAGLKNLLSTLEAMGQFARQGTMEISKRLFDPKAIIDETLKVMRADASLRRRALDVQMDENLPNIVGDKQKLVQVMVNLIRNAVQATKEGERICVSARAGSDGDVVLSVEDEGQGVPVELRERLFEPFVSGKGEGGMGMGLYMAKLVVESHRGEIRYAPKQGKGSRFEISLKAGKEA